MNAQTKKRIAKATVLLHDKQGRGILIPGNMILTAAHCLHWDPAGGMALGEGTLKKSYPPTGGR